MLRIAIALAWLGCMNLQNLAQAVPGDGIRAGYCGSLHRQGLVLPPGRKQPGRDCASGCHAFCRKSGVPEARDED